MPQAGRGPQPNTTKCPSSVAHPSRSASRWRSRPSLDAVGNGIGGLNHPLRLGRVMRTRLSAAVRALVADPRLAGCTHAQVLASVVLMGKTNHGSGRVQTTARELGRWLGLGESSVDHDVFPGLSAAKAVTTEVVTASSGRVEGVLCCVEPVWEVRGEFGAALALTKKEFAVLLALLEALFAPGWTGVDTPAGLLADRRGRGAATDRLALLLLVLHAREDGTVPLVGGTVKDGRGRCAATMARLLGCSVSGASKVLTRLRRWGVAETPSRRTSAGMRGKQLLLLPAVAQASAARRGSSESVLSSPEDSGGVGPAVCPGCAASEAAGAREELAPLAGEGWCQESLEDLLYGRPDAAPGDHEAPSEEEGAGQQPESRGVEGSEPEIVGRSDAASLHTKHSGVAEVLDEGAGCGRFSGSAVRGGGGLRERAGAREDAGSSSAAGRSQAVNGPLRGDKQDQLGSVQGASGPGQEVFARPVSVPEDLGEALAPVAGLWARLGGSSTRAWLATLVRGEVGRLRGLVEPELAQRVLAERLQRRLDEQRHPVVDPVGWLLKRGLPQQPGCWQRVCDEGVRMDTRGVCESCRVLVGDRRGLRQRVADELLEERLSGRLVLAERKVGREAERRLQKAVREELTRKEAARERTAAEQVVREASYELKRQAFAESEWERTAAPCADCGLEGSAGLCLGCTEHRGIKVAVDEATAFALVLTFDAGDGPGTRALWRECERATRTVLEERLLRLRAEGHDVTSVAFAGRRLIEELRDRRRRTAMERLKQHEEADQAARRAGACLLRKQSEPHTPQARQAVREAAEAARARVAERWLGELLAQLHSMRPPCKEPSAETTDWKRVLPELAAQALPEDASCALFEQVSA